ncbi:hypothetical protein [Sorangium sp. So ce1099]|uniref:hypothetical protein n=1 Tax=Sorangium sp. So ce1099 TaxID=3133331 RepID=UPI003F5DA6C7
MRHVHGATGRHQCDGEQEDHVRPARRSYTGFYHVEQKRAAAAWTSRRIRWLVPANARFLSRADRRLIHGRAVRVDVLVVAGRHAARTQPRGVSSKWSELAIPKALPLRLPVILEHGLSGIGVVLLIMIEPHEPPSMQRCLGTSIERAQLSYLGRPLFEGVPL